MHSDFLTDFFVYYLLFVNVTKDENHNQKKVKSRPHCTPAADEKLTFHLENKNKYDITFLLHWRLLLQHTLLKNIALLLWHQYYSLTAQSTFSAKMSEKFVLQFRHIVTWMALLLNSYVWKRFVYQKLSIFALQMVQL